MIKSPDLSIIIVSYNTKQITEDCLKSVIKSLKASTISYEIIVVDNGSEDGTVKMLQKSQQTIDNSQKEKPKFKIILNKENVGFGKANNQGVKIAQAENILFLNSDILVLSDAVEKLYKFYKQYETSINFLGGKLLNKDMTSQPSCGLFYSLPVIFAALFLRGDYWGLTRYSPNKVKEVDWISGACILTKKEYLNKINGFDENIFMYMDEIDLLYRAKKKNYKVYFYPEAKFIHLGSASSGERKYPVIQIFKGFLYFYKKHRSASARFILKVMLKLKAVIGVLLGNIFKNKYLKETYGKAYQIVEMDR